MANLNIDNKYTVVGELDRGGQGIVLDAYLIYQNFDFAKLAAWKDPDKTFSLEERIQKYRAEDIQATVNRLAQWRISFPFNPPHRVALKKPSPNASLERFVREARELMEINHPNIVSVIDFGKWDFGLGRQEPYYAMEFLDLKDEAGTDHIYKLKTVDHRVLVGIEACKALEYMHLKGLFHRDIKPDNIPVYRIAGKGYGVKITDLGIAKRTDDSVPGMTMTGMGMGTPRYMPYEQWVNAKNADKSSDIYSLGATLYELFTGRHPFFDITEENHMQIYDSMKPVVKRMDRQGINANRLSPYEKIPKALVLPTKFISGFPTSLEKLLVEMMAVRKKDRIQDVGEIRKRLEAYHKGEKSETLQSDSFRLEDRERARKRRESRRETQKTAWYKHPAAIASGIGAVLFTIAGALLFTGNSNGNGNINHRPRPPVNNVIDHNKERLEEYKKLEAKIGEGYKSLKSSYSESGNESFVENIDEALNMLTSLEVENEDEKRKQLLAKKDEAITWHHQFLYSGVDKKVGELESDIQRAKDNPYDKITNQRLASSLAELNRKARDIDGKRIPKLTALLEKLESLPDDIDELEARDPSKKFARAEQLYSKANRQFSLALSRNEKRPLTLTYQAIKDVKDILSKVQDKNDTEYKQINSQIDELERKVKAEENYLAEMILRFDNQEDLSYFTANSGRMSIKDGMLHLSDALITYKKEFNQGDFRFYASGDFSVTLGNYELIFAGNKVGLARQGQVIANASYNGRKMNFIKLEQNNSFNVYINGEKVISHNEKIGAKLQIKSKDIKIDNIAQYK